MIEFYQFIMNDIDGNIQKFTQFQNKVVLVVNVASKCGFTYQYEGLEKIYLRYKDKGFVIIGIPSNDFLGQEPGSNEEIKSFCSTSYGVAFPMMAKVKVVGKEMVPIYKYLTESKDKPEFAGRITWNFNKFLIGRNGATIGRFDSKVKPEDKELVDAIETALK